LTAGAALEDRRFLLHGVVAPFYDVQIVDVSETGTAEGLQLFQIFARWPLKVVVLFSQSPLPLFPLDFAGREYLFALCFNFKVLLLDRTNLSS
jgi:hypothetical protein